MPHRNIDYMLKDNERAVQITQSGPALNMSELPQAGEEVSLEAIFGGTLEVCLLDLDGNICHGESKHDLYRGEVGEMELLISQGELIEFSRPKIFGISRR